MDVVFQALNGLLRSKVIRIESPTHFINVPMSVISNSQVQEGQVTSDDMLVQSIRFQYNGRTDVVDGHRVYIYELLGTHNE